MLSNYGAVLYSELKIPSRGGDSELVEFKKFHNDNDRTGEV
jgi:hypothetical protein